MKMGERLKVEVLKTSRQPGGRTGILIRQSSLLPGPKISHNGSEISIAQDAGLGFCW